MRTVTLGLLVVSFVVGACGSAGPSASASPGAVAFQGHVAASPAPSPTPPPVTRIVFAEIQATGSVVYTLLPNGSGLKRLLPGSHGVPRWSPDGRQVAVSSSGGGIFETIVGADGSKPRDLKSPDSALALNCTAWSADGQRLLCEGWSPTRAGREGLYTVSAKTGGDLRRLTTSTDGVHDIPGGYSPDGTRIAFVRATYPPERHGQLWVCDADGGNARKLVDMLIGYQVSWSPDGRWILADITGSLLLFDLESVATEPRKITIPAGAASNARWSPDGTQIVFELLPRGAKASEISTVAMDGGALRRITSDAFRDAVPDWGTPAR